MNFDPENVPRLTISDQEPHADAAMLEENGEFVRASDYDQLLALYRADAPKCDLCDRPATCLMRDIREVKRTPDFISTDREFEPGELHKYCDTHKPTSPRG